MLRRRGRIREFVWTYVYGIPALLILAAGLVRGVRYGAHYTRIQTQGRFPPGARLSFFQGAGRPSAFCTRKAGKGAK